MARIPRKELIDESEVGVYHCINRCVRRAFLCGDDAVTGKNFDHRKAWIQKRLQFLAGDFGIEVLGFAVMSNHIHLILRNRPDVVAEWSDEQVARRWWNLFPQRRDGNGDPAEPEDHELAMIAADADVLAERRKRLSSLSWFMRALCEPVARRANKEDQVTGRFWEGRYKCQPLLDEAALLACSMYVDLNPIRAGIAETPETSEFTSAYERIQASCAQDLTDSADTYLSPLELAEETPQTSQPVCRASNRGCLPMKLREYLSLLDWTGRQTRRDRRSAIPGELAPILERLGILGDCGACK